MCGSVYLIYEGSLYSGQSIGSEFITFDRMIRVISVSTSFQSQIGVYEYKVLGIAVRDGIQLISNQLIIKIRVID